MRVLAYGATGMQMGPIVRQLLDAKCDPHVLTRHATLPPEIALPGVRIVKADVRSRAALHFATQGMDAVAFMVPASCSSAAGLVQFVRIAMEAAADAHVKMVVWNTSGRYPDEGEVRPEADAIIEAWSCMQDFGIPVAAVAPTKYYENLLAPWVVEEIAQRGRVPYPVAVDRKIGWIAARDVCEIMVKLLHRPDLGGKLYRLSGTEVLAGDELAQAFSDALGRDIGFHAMTADEMFQSLLKIFPEPTARKISDSYRREMVESAPPSLFHDMAPVLRDLPVKLTSAREWIAAQRPFTATAA